MPLFDVSISVRMVVEAVDSFEAERVAFMDINEATDDPSTEVVSTQIRAVQNLPDGWLDAYPFGGDGEETCGDILSR